MAGWVAITTFYLIKRPKCGVRRTYLIPLRKCNAIITNAQDHMEMGGAALHSLWPALSFRYPMITNQNLELLDLRNLSRLLTGEKPVEPQLPAVLSINKHFIILTTRVPQTQTTLSLITIMCPYCGCLCTTHTQTTTTFKLC